MIFFPGDLRDDNRRVAMKRLCTALGVIAVSTVASLPVAGADQPPAKTFVAVLSAGEEVPTCEPATNAARGSAVFHVRDEATGAVDFKVVANNLPGDVNAAHIHVAPVGVPGPIVQPLPLTGTENGVVAQGSFTNAGLVDAIRADPDGYYVNVHSGPPGVGCPSGVIRGQLGDRGPLNN
jgi:CHRD domain